MAAEVWHIPIYVTESMVLFNREGPAISFCYLQHVFWISVARQLPQSDLYVIALGYAEKQTTAKQNGVEIKWWSNALIEGGSMRMNLYVMCIAPAFTLCAREGVAIVLRVKAGYFLCAQGQLAVSVTVTVLRDSLWFCCHYKPPFTQFILSFWLLSSTRTSPRATFNGSSYWINMYKIIVCNRKRIA